MASVERSIEVSVPRDRMFRVVTDYESYPDFLPEMEEVSVLSRADGLVEAEFVLRIVKRVTYRLRLVEEAPSKVSWTLLSGDLRENKGSWSLEDADGGCRVTYSATVEVGMFVPGAIQARLVGEQLTQMLGAFADRALETTK